MRRAFVLVIPVLALLVSGWSGTVLKAQASKTARGTVTAMAGDSVTVKVGAVPVLPLPQHGDHEIGYMLNHSRARVTTAWRRRPP